jgi:Xaa-His dipeptidase
VTDAAAAQAAISDMDAALRHEYAAADPDVFVRFDAAWPQQLPMDEASTQRAVCMLCCLPNGVQAMSRDIPGLVQTSLNLGILTTDANTVQASFCVRSNVATQKEMLVARLRCLMAQLGGTVTVSGDYPAWEYRKDSPLRERMVAVFREQYGRDPKVEAIHAGVECGLFAGKLPGLDCVSFGPDLTEIHTCRERMHIASVQRVWRYTLEVLRRCK